VKRWTSEQYEDVDYMTAMYKGYSNSGETLEEIQDTIKDLHRQEASLQRQIDDA